ncbi:TcdA/TcdB catalytic glycosyltransferase domain-containing protein [Silvanigrella aquatica]|uniref:GT44 domain-containing protein n=1 Tax=Silvanigrella aquatica TaxID=1915309 RepID=A0A1L4D214_9BACT|nr:TcdA/TcdB catalytic glycosyltransferase domain-containing protein [Silvanigrella aquatica]APJ04231.1 hypothetical protein AXG55_10060 [Silvanigrella aquatica]
MSVKFFSNRVIYCIFIFFLMAPLKLYSINHDQLNIQDFPIQNQIQERLNLLQDAKKNLKSSLTLSEKYINKSNAFSLMNKYKEELKKTASNEKLEKKLLLDIMVSLDKIDAKNMINSNKFSLVYKKLFQIYDSYAKKILKDLHFVWLGGNLGEIQKSYIEIWAKVNPEYKIHIWYDPNSLYVYQTSSQIRKKIDPNGLISLEDYNIMNTNDIRTFMAKQIIDMQDEFYVGVKNKDIITDNDRIQFLIDKNIIDKGQFLKRNSQQLKKEFTENMSDFLAKNKNVILHDVKEVMLNSKLAPYYKKEMNERMNLAAASDMVRLEVLIQKGGIYIDVDILPTLKNEVNIFSGKLEKEELLKMQKLDNDLLKNINIAMYESLFNNLQISGRKYSTYYYDHLMSDKKIPDTYKFMFVKMKAHMNRFSHLKFEDLFNKIGKVYVIEGIFKMAGNLNNNIIASHKMKRENDFLNQLRNKIIINYEDLIKNYRGVRVAIENANYEVYLNSTNRTKFYRYDGIKPNTFVTTELTGPLLYEEIIKKHFPARLTNFIPNLDEKFSSYTEEDDRSSWSVKKK